MSNELVPLPEQFPILATDLSDIGELVEQNLGGQPLNLNELERIKVGAGGTPGFVISQGDDTDTEKAFEAIVVHQHAARVYYKTGMDEGGSGSPPDCRSDNAITGHGDNGEGEGEHACATCPQAKWDSHPRGTGGQACSSRHNIYLYRAGNNAMFPSLLILPPTSLRAWRDHSVKLLNKMTPLTGALHRFSTVKERSKGGQDFTRVVPELVRPLTAEEQANMSMFAEQMKQLVVASPTDVTDG